MNNLPRIAWDGQANPRNTDMPTIMYAMRRADTDGLLLDSCTFDELTAENDGIMTLDALVVMAARLEPRMEILSRLMSGVGELKVVNMQTSNPLRKNGAVHVAVMWELSDGQTVSVWFHNPDTTPAKLTPMDDLVSWKWLLNKRDVTIVAAPERGTDLSPREVARRVMRLAEKNSAAFQKANANKSEKERLIAEYEASNGAKRVELESLLKQLEVAQFEADNKTSEIPQFASDWTLENLKFYIKEQGKKDPLNPALRVLNDADSKSWNIVVPWDNSIGKLQFSVAWYGRERQAKTRADAIDELFLRIQQQTIIYKRSQLEADTAPKVVPAIQDDGSIKVTDKEGTQYTVSAANGVVEIRLPNGALAGSYYPQNVLEINGGLKMSTGVLSAVEVDKLKVVARQMIERAALTNELLGIVKTGSANKAIEPDVNMLPTAFKDAPEDFKLWLAGFVDADIDGVANPLTTAINLIRVAKANGASIEWGFFEDAAATMDSAVLDSVQAAIEELKMAMNVALNNAPINEAEGDLEQAELERKNAVEFQEAIEVLETLDVDQEWDAVPALDATDSFDVSKYKKQCYAVAEAFKKYLLDIDSDKAAGEYEAVVKDNSMLGKKAVEKIELVIHRKGGKAAPIDYVQYDSATLDSVVLDGDFRGHPFRGNQYKNGSQESGSAVRASMRAKHAERKGDHKGAKQAHKAAHYAHMAASVHAKGKAKGYHTKMANFHATKAI